MAKFTLPFEKDIEELSKKIEKAKSDEERRELSDKFDQELALVYAKITPWQRVQLARHPDRPRMLTFIELIFQDFFELHGDRAVGDDPAMICGFARFEGQTVAVVGQQKGTTTEDKVYRNFGMAQPSGYRKALRIMELAERMDIPVLSFVDTPAAHPGIEAEQFGQGPSIANNLRVISGLNTPIFAVILGEGGSGGALGIAVADYVAMLEYAVYMICPPERCAEILWRDAEQREEAASALRVSPQDLIEMKIIDSIVHEPVGAAHRYPDETAQALSDEIRNFLKGCAEHRWSPKQRQERFRKMGEWAEEVSKTTSALVES